MIKQKIRNYSYQRDYNSWYHTVSTETTSAMRSNDLSAVEITFTHPNDETAALLAEGRAFTITIEFDPD